MKLHHIGVGVGQREDGADAPRWADRANWQAWLSAIERLDLTFFVDAEHDGVRRRIDVEPDDVAQFVDELGVLRQLELPDPMGWSPCARQMRWTEVTLTPAAWPSPRQSSDRFADGASIVSVTTRAAIRGSSFGMREGRVLSCRSPSTPSAAKRSCQRQTQVLDLPVRAMIAFVPAPSALSKTICARQTCFCGAFRSLTTPRSRSSSAAVTENEMPFRMPQLARRKSAGNPSGIQTSDFIH